MGDRDYDSCVFKVSQYSPDLADGIIGFPRQVAYAGKAAGAVIFSMVSHGN
jgi:hypothetical protein